MSPSHAVMPEISKGRRALRGDKALFFANDTGVVCEFPVMLYAIQEG